MAGESIYIEDRHLTAICFVFIAAGYETTTTTLSLIMYVLAKYPKEQNRIYDELTTSFPNDEEEFSYSLSSCFLRTTCLFPSLPSFS